MKKIFLPLLLTTHLLFCSCGGNKVGDKICDFIEEATERTEKATTLREIEDINKKLTQNIAIYTLSLSEEEYKKWSENPEEQMALEKAKDQYITCQQNRKNFLKGN